MDIKEFAQEFIENVKMSVEMTGSDYDQELATSILEYMEDNGEVNAPEICSFQKTRTRITAYDYNDEAESLDLFYLVKAETLLGKVNNNKVEQGYNYLMAFYREAMNGQLFKNQDVAPSDEIVEVAKLVQSTKGQIKQLRIFIDRCSIEAFDADGKMAMTNLVFPSEPYNTIKVKGGKVTIYDIKH
jgi:sucrose-6-phosphate hydrolase SacC (GH32 family)